MHGYIEFPSDAKNIFKDIIQDYNLKVVSESSSEIIFKSNNCIIEIMTEYDYVQFYFKQSENEKWMFLGPFLEAVYPNENIIIQKSPENLNRVEKIRFNLKKELGLIKKYCVPILTGDFSWKHKYQV